MEDIPIYTVKHIGILIQMRRNVTYSVDLFLLQQIQRLDKESRICNSLIFKEKRM